MKPTRIFLILFLMMITLPVTTLRAQPERAFDLYSAGVRASYAYSYGEAIRLFSEAIAAKPDFTAAYYSRGVALFKNKENDKAFEDFMVTT